MSRSLYALLARKHGRPIDAITRREMLRATLAASAGMLISTTPLRASWMTSRPAGKRVVVIGAGFAGLACAHELTAAGYDVTVVEARGRVGGRVLSFDDMIKGEQKNVEGGAELIGSNHPTWVSYADQFKLEFLDVTEDKDAEAPIVLGGKRLSEDDSNKLWEELEEAHKPILEDAAKINDDEPWTSPDAAALDKKTTKEWINGLKISDECKHALDVEFMANNAVDTDKQSYLGNLTQIKGGGLEKYFTESEVYRCKGGNQQLARKLVESISENRLVRKLAVTEIKSKGDVMVVTCADSRTLEADDVILTVPPSVWSKIKFEPGLPAAIKPQMGVAVKYLAAVKKHFWKEAKLSPDSMSDGDVSMTWEATNNQGDEGGAVLTAFSGGHAAEQCRSHKGADRDKAYAKELEVLYPGYGQNFDSSRFMDWPNDVWTMAGYSFPAPGQVTTVGPLLRKGLGHLHFAGEHTCYKFVGYMEGALNSGVALAKRLAARDGVLEGAVH